MTKTKEFEKITRIIVLSTICFVLSIFQAKAQSTDPNQGLRADWMRGATGLLWLPSRNYNGNIEGIRLDDYLTQINNLRTIDHIQLPLTSPNIYSPIHVGPHALIESFWEGDTDNNGDPINLVVPREAIDDPLLNWLKAVRAAGLKSEVYVNSYNLLARVPGEPLIQNHFPDVSERWMEWCDTNPEAQAFINSQPYHGGDGRRRYMFCYAEFILKEYAIRYGDLIDAWCFDSADNIMEDECGDDPASGDINEQRIYQAFAEACHAGNPDAALSFNNSVGNNQGNPFTTATLFDDYTFGHPFGGAGNMVVPEILYTYNFGIIEWMEQYNGYAFRDDTIIWNDNVVSHFFPKQSTTSWNAGNTPCLTDEEFVEWTSTGLINGGTITWGTPLVRTNLENNPVLTLQPYALTQFELTDTYLKEFQNPGAPNWARQRTILSEAIPGVFYSHHLVDGFDFWDPEGVGVTGLSVVSGNLPSWATLTETTPGTWTLSGTPTETVATDYTFELMAQDADGGTNRELTLHAIGHPAGFTDPGNGTPVWYSNPIVLANATANALQNFESLLKKDIDFYDFENDELTINKIAGPDWLIIQETSPGIWELSGIPLVSDVGENVFTLDLNDGVNSSTTEILITVNLTILTNMDVQITAEESTNYGINTVATMYSEIQMALDGLATYRISIDVTPPTGQAIISGFSGGITTLKSWGIGDGTDANQNDIFRGSDNEWTESINNIQILDFDPNGGALTTNNLTLFFKEITIGNSQSPNDFVSFRVGGVQSDYGRSENQTQLIDLEAATSVTNIEDFAVGTGDNMELTNKWSVEGITVSVDFNSVISSTDQTSNQVESFKLFPNPANDWIKFNIKSVNTRIYDVTGRNVFSNSQGENEIDISNLNQGLYILQIQTIEGNLLSQKFLKI